MKIFTIDDVVLHCSEEMIREFEEDVDPEYDPELEINSCLDSSLEQNPKIKELTELYSKINGLKGKIILNAHGDYNYRDHLWVYIDDNKEFSVQKWINKYDGKYSTLILHICNSLSKEVYSKKSAVVHYNNIYSGLDQDWANVQTEIYIPKIEYVDSYIIDNEIEKMRKMLKDLKEVDVTFK
ncbi:MAG: hypothetical protein IB618_00540 [Candidatus Pacearchaeota archaeon]|nr:MAG: hypothetical protein IB618_00540 [Candidatus Pacearchaeota archaeon]